MEPFKHIIQVNAADIDALGHVNNVVYLRWVQDVATAHWEHRATPEIKSAYLWVILRHEIDYKHPVYLQDEVVGYTWVAEPQGPKIYRFVRLCLAGTEKVVAEAVTTWCLLDAKTMRPKRIDQEVLSAF